MENRAYWVLIPPFIISRSDLSLNEKVVYGKINGLIEKEGYCFASNEYIANQIGLSPMTTRRAIYKLRDKELIFIELIRNDKKEIESRKIYLKNPVCTDAHTLCADLNIPMCTDAQDSINIRLKKDTHIVPKSETSTNETPNSTASTDYLLSVPATDLPDLMRELKVTPREVRSKAEDLYNYCHAKGKRYKNYKLFLRNALKRDFPLDTFKRL